MGDQDVEEQAGECPEHGRVTGTRTVPVSGFPFVVTMPQRWAARRKPFRCPDCGKPVT